MVKAEQLIKDFDIQDAALEARIKELIKQTEE
jgi:hypothetical protein